MEIPEGDINHPHMQRNHPHIIAELKNECFVPEFFINFNSLVKMLNSLLVVAF